MMPYDTLAVSSEYGSKAGRATGLDRDPVQQFGAAIMNGAILSCCTRRFDMSHHEPR